MDLGAQILAAVGLDLLIGDPRWIPHPVRLIGALASGLEKPTRRILPARAAGLLTVAIVVGLTASVTWGLLQLAQAVHPAVGAGLSIILLSTSFATRDSDRARTSATATSAVPARTVSLIRPMAVPRRPRTC